MSDSQRASQLPANEAAGLFRPIKTALSGCRPKSAAAPSPPNVLIYTVHKAASRFLTRLTNRVARRLRMDYHSIANDENFDAVFEQSWRDFIEEGDKRGCFGPIRLGAAEPSVPEDVSRFSVVAHLRDPRDVLTSLYFSHAYSHGPRRFDPGGEAKQHWEQMGIDAFVLERAQPYRKRYDVFCSQLMGRPNVIFVKYEELVTDYNRWLARFLDAFCEWARPLCLAWRANNRSDTDQPIPTLARLQRVMFQKFQDEFVVADEDVHRHKRQIVPGDHRRKLKRETIDRLNEEFRDVLAHLEYPALGPAGPESDAAAA